MYRFVVRVYYDMGMGGITSRDFYVMSNSAAGAREWVWMNRIQSVEQEFVVHMSVFSSNQMGE